MSISPLMRQHDKLDGQAVHVSISRVVRKLLCCAKHVIMHHASRELLHSVLDVVSTAEFTSPGTLRFLSSTASYVGTGREVAMPEGPVDSTRVTHVVEFDTAAHVLVLLVGLHLSM